MRPKIRVATKGLNEYKAFLEKAEQTVLRKSKDLRTALAEDGAELAYDLFMDAKYNGYKGDIWVDVGRDVGNSTAIIAEGSEIKFIEYGTGLKSGSPDYWFFSARGRSPISLDGGGEHAHYTRYLREKDENGSIHWENAVDSGNEVSAATKTLRGLGEKLGGFESVTKPNSYITGPSYPHRCMQRTAEHVAEQIIPKAKEIGLIK